MYGVVESYEDPPRIAANRWVIAALDANLPLVVG
jgi:hypothetical protein